ncbi:hypothetical protein PENTCL1PPCAC_17121, partial [Pristionchus entomophagus]
FQNTFAWHNSMFSDVMFSDGYFTGPRAVGIHMIASSLPTAILALLNLFRYAQITNPSIHEILCHRASILLHSFWIGLNALLVYSIPALFFLPDADSIDQIQPLLNNAVDTFVELKPKPIVGLSIF